MPPESDPSIRIELLVQAGQPQLLEGLESWLRLGLISDRQVRQLCQQYLTCAVELAPVPQADPKLVDDFAADFVTNFVTANPVQPAVVDSPAPTPARPPSWLSQRLQSLAAEISVIWLLVLGVFMVVVSSGVLAASQWRNVPPAGQYGILLAYTLAFWGAGFWTGRQPRLQLTARMLQITTLLIIPVNFWMMDGLRLWQSGAGLVVMAIATLILTGVNIALLRPTQPSRLTLVNSVGLSWLHWGWVATGVPVVATYLGTIGTSLVLWRQSSTQSSEEATDPPPLSLSFVAIAFATLVLIGRAILVAGVPASQLGLAFGLCGWLWCWVTRQEQRRSPLAVIGTGLLLLGWAVAALAEPPWQAIAVSGLGMWLLLDSLKRFWQPGTLFALFLVGLQTTWLVGRLVPPPTRQALLDWVTTWAGTTETPAALLGVTLLPYVGLTLWFAGRLRRWEQSELARSAELMALVLGGVLSAISLANPNLRSLNLLISTGLLAIPTWRRGNPYLIYLTHTVGVGAIASSIASLFPNLSQTVWAQILLVGTLAELGLTAVLSIPRPWRQSAWYLGLGLATVSYVLLLAQVPTALGWTWLLVPAALSALTTRVDLPERQWAGWFSLLGFLLVQPLTLDFPGPRLVGLALATGCLMVITAQLRHLVMAIATLGFGLALLAAGVWQIWGDRLTDAQILVLPAIAILLLWLLRDVCRRGATSGHRLYEQAADGWAAGVTILYLLILTSVQVALWNQETLTLIASQPQFNSWELVAGIAVLVGAIAYRLWQEPVDIGFYGLAWALELLAASTILLAGGSLNVLGMTTLALGLGSQLLGDVRVRRTGQPYWPSWNGVPLLYALLGLVWQHQEFTAYTGLYTLAAALIGLGVGRRYPQGQPLSYFSLLLVSAAAYELLLYQLSQAKGGDPGDGVVLLAALAGAIALGYRWGDRWLRPTLRLAPQSLPILANLHWGFGSALLFLTFLFPRSPLGANLWVGVTLLLAAYALALGNRRWHQTSAASTWTYLGILEALLALSHLLYLVNPQVTFFTGWWGAIACPLALALYVAPWDTWGWPPRPWQRTAMVLPGALALGTSWAIALPALLVIAAFYAWLAKLAGQIRLSYVSLLLADWAILRFFWEQNLREPLWYAVVLTATLLYPAQIDPALRQQSAREQRHSLRTLATGLLCLTALYQSELGTRSETLLYGLLVIGLSVGWILLGLFLRTRAFLYVGTITFVLKVLRQLWVFITDYSLLLWAVGIVLGLLFIWVAATFEARRTQVSALVQYWTNELDAWD